MALYEIDSFDFEVYFILKLILQVLLHWCKKGEKAFSIRSVSKWPMTIAITAPLVTKFDIKADGDFNSDKA